MPSLWNPDDSGRDTVSPNNNVPDVARNTQRIVGSPGLGKEDSERRFETKEVAGEAECLVLEMIENDIIAAGKTGTYTLSYPFLKRLVSKIARMLKATNSSMNLRRRAIFDCVWDNFGRLEDLDILDRVSEITSILESMIDED